MVFGHRNAFLNEVIFQCQVRAIITHTTVFDTTMRQVDRIFYTIHLNFAKILGNDNVVETFSVDAIEGRFCSHKRYIGNSQVVCDIPSLTDTGNLLQLVDDIRSWLCNLSSIRTIEIVF